MKKTEPTQAVAVPAAQSIVPDYLKDKMGQGSGLKADIQDMIVPRIKLLHGTSKEPENFNDAEVGNFWMNVVDIPLSTSFLFIPVSNRKRVLLMRPMDDKTGEPILARADDGKTWDKTGEWDVKLKGRNKADTKWKIDHLNVEASGLLKFGTSDPTNEDSNPAATVFHEYLIYLPEQNLNIPVLFSLARTAAKPARELNSKIELRGGPMQGMLFEAKVVKDTNDNNQEFFNIQFKSAGYAAEADYNKCVEFTERFKEYRGAGEEDLAGETNSGKAGSAAPKDRGDV